MTNAVRPFATGEREDEGVLDPRLARARIATPEVDDLLAVDVGAESSAHVLAVTEVLDEGRADGLEPVRDEPVATVSVLMPPTSTCAWMLYAQLREE